MKCTIRRQPRNDISQVQSLDHRYSRILQVFFDLFYHSCEQFQLSITYNFRQVHIMCLPSFVFPKRWQFTSTHMCHGMTVSLLQKPKRSVISHDCGWVGLRLRRPICFAILIYYQIGGVQFFECSAKVILGRKFVVMRAISMKDLLKQGVLPTAKTVALPVAFRFDHHSFCFFFQSFGYTKVHFRQEA